MNIVSRADWGFPGWTKGKDPHNVEMKEKTEFFVHYDGANEITRTGNAIPKAINAGHKANGWAGIGYNFVVDQAGNVYEGRGWDNVPAHCPKHNRQGIGVQVAIGGLQQPSDAAKASVVALYEEACRRAGRKLTVLGHRDGKATACPGSALYDWAKAGMALTGAVTASVPPSGVKPTPPAHVHIPVVQKPLAHLAIDGSLGPETIKAWQRVMGTHVDGVISRPSQLIEAVQRHLIAYGFRLEPDGKFGPATTRALQRYLGTRDDGVISEPKSQMVVALQIRLSSGKF